MPRLRIINLATFAANVEVTARHEILVTDLPRRHDRRAESDVALRLAIVDHLVGDGVALDCKVPVQRRPVAVEGTELAHALLVPPGGRGDLPGPAIDGDTLWKQHFVPFTIPASPGAIFGQQSGGVRLCQATEHTHRHWAPRAGWPVCSRFVKRVGEICSGADRGIVGSRSEGAAAADKEPPRGCFRITMANQSLVRYVNERRILTLLRIEGELTRADIARRLSLTRASITHLVDGLMARRLLREAEPRPGDGSRRRDLGRPGINVGLDPTGGYFLGVEIGVGVMRFALLDLSMTLVGQRTVHTDRAMVPEDAVAQIGAYADALGAMAAYHGMIRGGGVTVPGLVRRDGFVVHLPILGWREVKLAEMLGERLDLPVLVENNANAAAFGEAYVFPREKHDHIVYLKLGTGCGGAVIADGRLLRGASGMATEFGHIRVGADGPRCDCGRLGCLEPRVNLAALRRAFGAGEGVDPVTQVPPAWKRGDPRAVRAVDEIVSALSLGLVTLTNAFNPDEIVLGGAMGPVLELVIGTLQERLERDVVPGMLVPRISLSRLGDLHCAIGAAAIAHHEASDISHVGLATFG